MSPQKRYHLKRHFHGIFVSFLGGMTASKRLQPTWACPPKELPFLRRQPWRRRGKGFRHGGRSNRQGSDRWLLQWRDGKHLRRNAAPLKKGRKRWSLVTSLWWLFAEIFLGSWNIFGNTQVFLAKGRIRMVETSFWWRLMAASKRSYPTNEDMKTLPRENRVKEMSTPR